MLIIKYMKLTDSIGQYTQFIRDDKKLDWGLTRSKVFKLGNSVQYVEPGGLFDLSEIENALDNVKFEETTFEPTNVDELKNVTRNDAKKLSLMIALYTMDKFNQDNNYPKLVATSHRETWGTIKIRIGLQPAMPTFLDINDYKNYGFNNKSVSITYDKFEKDLVGTYWSTKEFEQKVNSIIDSITQIFTDFMEALYNE